MSVETIEAFAIQHDVIAGVVLVAIVALFAVGTGIAAEAWARRSRTRGLATSTHRWTASMHIEGAGVSLVAMLIGQAVLSGLPGSFEAAVARAAKGIDLAIIALAAVTALRVSSAWQRHRGQSGGTYAGAFQAARLVILCAAALLLAARASDRSPAFILSGIGAVAALFALVFKDTIISFTAGMRLIAEDEARPGDWIESADGRINGIVVEIALHNVRIDCLDGSTLYVPNTLLTGSPIRNWRRLGQHGGRKMTRRILVDPRGVTWSSAVADATVPQLRTNVEAYCAEAVALLREHPSINSQLPIAVCVGDTTSVGLAIEVTAYTRALDWLGHENAKSAVMARLLASLSTHDLVAVCERQRACDRG